MTEKERSAIAAAVILIGFGLLAYFLPTIMIAIGDISTVAAGIFAVLFVLAFFGIFWIRARVQKGK
jgi:drug/metabolite transporter (DMT)-like permease